MDPVSIAELVELLQRYIQYEHVGGLGGERLTKGTLCYAGESFVWISTSELVVSRSISETLRTWICKQIEHEALRNGVKEIK